MTVTVLDPTDRHGRQAPDEAAKRPPGRAGWTVAQRVTPRKRLILTLAAEGLTNAAIGRRLCIAESTVDGHLCETRRALGAADRTHAVVLAHRLGLIDLTRPHVADKEAS